MPIYNVHFYSTLVMYIFMYIINDLYNVHFSCIVYLVICTTHFHWNFAIPAIEMTGQNAKKICYIRFARELRAKCHAAIRDCYIRFNNAGVAVLKLQSGRILYFARAVILSVYGDFPAGTIMNRILYISKWHVHAICILYMNI
jgi:hypothetical protein